jgi:hypothetical protein
MRHARCWLTVDQRHPGGCLAVADRYDPVGSSVRPCHARAATNPITFETFILQSDACFENQTLQLGDCSATAQSKGLSS